MEKYVWVGLSFFLLVVGGASGAQIPAMFVFGDSLSDPGNNNDLITLAKANYPHYGIDFPTGATGRYCNGAVLPDYLGFLLEFGLIPAFKDCKKGSKCLQGVNFASAAAGILNDTGNIAGKVITMHEQVNNFGNKIVPLLSSQVLTFDGEVLSRDDFLAKSLFYSNMGNNDLLLKYFFPVINPLRRTVTPAYEDSIITQYTIHLKNLYKYGARKFLVTSLAPLGCTPGVNVFYGNDVNNQCYEPHNDLVKRFNIKLKLMIQQLNADLPSAYFLYWDVYSFLKDAIDNPSKYGFKNSHSACCGAGRANALALCSPTALVCHNRSEYTFWDAFHPTDAANKITARIAYEGTLQNTFPMNVKQLVNM